MAPAQVVLQWLKRFLCPRYAALRRQQAKQHRAQTTRTRHPRLTSEAMAVGRGTERDYCDLESMAVRRPASDYAAGWRGSAGSQAGHEPGAGRRARRLAR